MVDDEIKEIIENLNKIEKETEQSRNIATSIAEEQGFQIETANKVRSEWKTISLSLNKEDLNEVTASGVYMTRDWLKQAESTYSTLKIPFSMVSLASGTAGTFAEATAVSAGIANAPISPELIKLLASVRQRSEQDELINRLNQVEPSLGRIYVNAWSNLYTAPFDPTRGPMFLMREVIRQLIDHYVSEEEIKNQSDFVPDSTSRSGVTLRHKLEYLSKFKTKDTVAAQSLKDGIELFINIYNKLSSAHKPGELDIDKTKDFLFQANSLIKLFLDMVGSN
jgi:hypothetical protein